MTGKLDVDAFSKEVFGAVVSLTKTAGRLPESGSEFMSTKSTVVGFQETIVDAAGNRLVHVMEKLWRKKKRADRTTPFPTSPAALTDRFQLAVDAVDGWLEQADASMDVMCGVQSAPVDSIQRQAVERRQSGRQQGSSSGPMLRPQLLFNPPVENSALLPFIPKLHAKPNAVVPLADYFKAQSLLSSSSSSSSSSQSAISAAMQSHLTHRVGAQALEPAPFLHPYEPELLQLQHSEDQMKPPANKERIYGDLDATPRTWVDTPEALDIMIGKLSLEPEIAVDLEQHFFRSYQGFVCLMQISTRTEDFLVDTLELRPYMERMNVVFTNPKVVKVMHGADFDIKWLQRDFCVYVVNLFDTGQASRVLQYAKKSLAFLLDKFCNVQADKRYQLADWRVRPIPKDMENYAVQDTHYLLYIYDRLRNELSGKSAEAKENLVQTVLNRSRQLCLQVYEKPPVTNATSYLEMYNKVQGQMAPFTGPQIDALAELYQWRDELARQQDESPAFVLPNRMLLSICEKLPTTTEELLALCVPVPPLTRANAHEILSVLHKARNGTLKTPAGRAFFSITSAIRQQNAKVNLPFASQDAVPATPKRDKTLVPFVRSPAAPEAQVNPANASGNITQPLTRDALFSTTSTLEVDTKKHNAALAKNLEEIGKSFDPLFASRVADAAGVFVEEDNNEKNDDDDEPSNPLKRDLGSENDVEDELAFPKSLAEIHKLTQRNKRQKKKKSVAVSVKESSPLDYSKMGVSEDNPINVDASPGTFMKTLGWQDAEIAKNASSIAPNPTGQTRIVLEQKVEKKGKKQKAPDATQGFDVTKHKSVPEQQPRGNKKQGSDQGKTMHFF